MPYNLTLTNGTVLETLADGSADTTTTSINLIGKNFAGYGLYLNENFIKLMENFASSSAPANPLNGQLWFDSTNKILKVWNSANAIWKVVGGSVVQSSQPSSSLAGDLWLNTSNGTLNAYNGSSWIQIGPNLSSLVGTYYSNFGQNSHNVGNVMVNNQVAAVVVASNDTAFAASPSIGGFSNLQQGWNIVNNMNVAGNVTAAGLTITGTASLNGVPIATTAPGGTATFVAINSTPVGNTTPSTGAFTTLSASGGAAITGSLTVNGIPVATASGGAINSTPIGNATPSSGAFTTLSASGVTTLASTLTAASFQGVIGNVSPNPGSFTTISVSGSITPVSNVGINIGSVSNWFNNIYGTAIHAQYADLAERFESDQPLSAGTVVELGGPAEIMAAGEDLSENVFGVISTNAAYLMNSKAGVDSTHPPVACQGRVPVKVIGKIRKGDRLVSAGNGFARAGSRSEINTWNVIGRALENKTDAGEGIIEAAVKLNS